MEPAASKKWGWLVLLTSSTTLVCCALPILLVALGFGAVSAALFANLPFLVTLAQHKAWIFAGSGAVLALGAWLLYRSGRACPADPDLAELCNRAYRWNSRLLRVSVTIWTVGFAAAYLALPVYRWFGSG